MSVPIAHHGRPESDPGLARRLLGWGSTGLFVFLMTFSGVLYLIPVAPVAESVRLLGYPPYILSILGISKLLGVTGLMLPGTPRIREWSYAGFSFLLILAFVSHVWSGDKPAHWIPPVIAGALLAASYVFSPTAIRKADPSARSGGTSLERN